MTNVTSHPFFRLYQGLQETRPEPQPEYSSLDTKINDADPSMIYENDAGTSMIYENDAGTPARANVIADYEDVTLTMKRQ